MYTRYFKIETENGPVTEDVVMDALKNTYGSVSEGDKVTEVDRVEDNPAIAEMKQTLECKPQQATVPIQFVWHDGCLYHENSCRGFMDAIEENCTVEQIGAVLYVRSKSE